MAVTLYGRKTVDTIVAHLDGVRDGVKREAEVIHERAKGYLDEARASTHWFNIDNPESTGSRVEVTISHGDVDSFVNLEGPNPMAVEFGHEPSGYFANTPTRPPHGLYILTHATGFTDLSTQ